MEEKKLLKINPSDFSFSNNKTKKSKPDKKPEGNIRVRNTNAKKQTNTLRKKSLLNLIRQHQQKQYDMETDFKKHESTKEQQANAFNKEFEEAKNYLNTIAEKRSSSVSNHHLSNNHSGHSAHNNTIKHYPSSFTPTPMALNMSVDTEPMPTSTSIPVVESVTSADSNSQPAYGCLKNGNLPTYRNYMNKTLSKKEPLKIGDDVDRGSLYNVSKDGNATPLSQSSSSLENRFPSLYKKEEPSVSLFSNNAKKSKKIKQRKTIRRKHKVGRSKYYSKIGVLVSNKTIRNTISNQMQHLKMVPIHDVRSYLIKNGFIKVGSNTPNDVLRKMYESALLICGEVKNHNPDNLLYNFFNESTTDS